MKNKKRVIVLFAAFLFVCLFAMPVTAKAGCKTVKTKKTLYGSYYVWRPYNTQFYIQKKGSGTIRKIKKNAYTIAGVTNGTVLYYSVLDAKFNGEVTLYKYYLKNGKQKKISRIKNSLHILGAYDVCVYGNGASGGRPNNTVYSFNVYTGSRKVILRNSRLEKADGRYLYILKNGAKYRYDLKTKKLIRFNWNYDY